jgi:hypothetical protein
MVLLRKIGQFFLVILEEFDWHMNYAQQGISMLGTVPPGQREEH